MGSVFRCKTCSRIIQLKVESFRVSETKSVFNENFGGNIELAFIQVEAK